MKRPWVLPTIALVIGLGIGLGGPMVASRYANPYLPGFLQESVHPLEGAVRHKQIQQDRLLMTITTPEGTILATFQQQIPEIDLLVEERDLVTLDVQHYQPFITDPPVLRVIKHQEETPPNMTPADTPLQSTPPPEPGSTHDSPSANPSP